MNDALEQLANHPFTLIGLSDREKFHTGMLAFTIRYYWDSKRGENRHNLIKELWGNEAFQKSFENGYEIGVQVEKDSIDLVVEVEKTEEKAFAEVKFKTDLHSDQMAKYKKKHPDAKGVILGLFPPAVSSQTSDYVTCSFPSQITEMFKLKQELLQGESDEVALIRLWNGYLSTINQLQKSFRKYSTCEIPDHDEFRRKLQKIKLKGIFERYRLALIWKKIAEENKNVFVILFNTHGNTGLHMQIPIGQMNNDKKIRYAYGLQWQGNKLKLFLEDYETNNNFVRDELLKNYLTECIYKKYKDADACHLIDKRKNLNRNGKFRSITIGEWPIFGDISSKSETLIEMVSFLANDEIKKHLYDELRKCDG